MGDYTEKRLAAFSAPLPPVMFTCTGSEAYERALRTGGRRWQGRRNRARWACPGVTGDLVQLYPSIGPGADPVRVLPSPSTDGHEEDGVIWRDANGPLDGFRTEDRHEVSLKRDPCTYREAIEVADVILLAEGITSRLGVAVGMSDGWLERGPSRAASAADKLPLRITACFIGAKSVSPLDQAMAEGAKSGHDAAAADRRRQILHRRLRQRRDECALLHVECTGLPCLTKEECIELARPAQSSGFQMAFQAIGFVAISQIITSIATVRSEDPREDMRHRIAHLGWVRPRQIERLA